MSAQSLPDAPSPPGLPLLGQAPELRRDPLGAMLRWGRDFGPVVRLQLLHQPAYLVADPQGIKHILVDNHRNYVKETRGYDALRLILGQGLLTSEGELWRRQRRIAQPAFKRERLAALLPAMDRAGRAAAQRLDALADRGATVDLHREMTRLTLHIASETLLGRDVSGDADAVGRALNIGLAEAEARINGTALPLWIPTPRNRRLRWALALLRRVMDETLRTRRAGPPVPDLLQLLLDARDEETGQGMSDAQLMDEILTMFLAGHETTANQLTWTLYLLAQPENRAAGETLRQEHLRFWAEQGDRTPTPTDLRRLRYSDLVLRESMRLFPPAWIFSRAPVEDDEVCGFRVRAKAWVFVSPYVMHRLPSLWPEPERFLPERFEHDTGEDGDGERPRYAYFPFGGGPRLCIGSNFAALESLVLLARLWPRYQIAMDQSVPVIPKPQITLRPLHGLSATLRPAADRPAL